MGGGRKQFQVLVNPEKLLSYGVTLHEVHDALKESNANVTGGYLDDQGPRELLVRNEAETFSAESTGTLRETRNANDWLARGLRLEYKST